MGRTERLGAAAISRRDGLAALRSRGPRAANRHALDRHERQPDENPPIGIILCTETSREQIELLEMHKDGIVVAEYWTALPPKAELQARIQAIYREAQERIARRQLTAAAEEDTDE